MGYPIDVSFVRFYQRGDQHWPYQIVSINKKSGQITVSSWEISFDEQVKPERSRRVYRADDRAVKRYFRKIEQYEKKKSTW